MTRIIFARAQIQGYSRNDILLYPSTSNVLSTEGMDGETIDLKAYTFWSMRWYCPEMASRSKH
jgi:hypothetical protein